MTGRPPLPIGTWGTIRYTRTSAGWRARTLFRDLDGITREVNRTRPTKGSARDALTEHLLERTAPAGDDLTAESPLEQAVHVWLADRAAAGLTSNTMRRYREVARDHVLPGLGAVRLREATVPRLEGFLRTLTTRIGAATARLARTILSGTLSLAVRYGALRQNPMRDVAGVTVTKRDPHALTIDQVRAVRAAVHTWQYPPQMIDGKPRRGRPRTAPLVDLIDFLLATGARVAEALAIRWTDVDLEAGTVTIAGTLSYTDETPPRLYRQDHPKDRTARTIPLTDHAVTMLTRRRINAEGNTHDVVFPTATGSLWDPKNARTALRRALKPAGLDWITPHELRRTVATELDRALGIDAAASTLGHADKRTTERHYVQRVELTTDARETIASFFT